MKGRKVLFLYLKAFSFTGGIEKFNRCFMKALHELSVDGHFEADAVSPYDSRTDERYFPKLRLQGYSGNRFLFVLNSIRQAFRYDVLVLGHVNLAIVGIIIKKLKPSIKLMIVVHGIEVWKRLPAVQRMLLEKASSILSVSEYTKGILLQHNPEIDAAKIRIFPNTLDPYFTIPTSFEKPKYLQERYKIESTEKILLTVTRLSFTEKYKGYNQVIQLLGKLSLHNQHIRYLLCGKSDSEEQTRVQHLIDDKNLSAVVTRPGYIKDEELVDHYLLADLFVMPSKKEGFGIVFIEALACGLNVVAGSKDGSVEALLYGELGQLIDPDSELELTDAILRGLEGQRRDPLVLQQRVIAAFGFQQYKNRLKTNLTSLVSVA